MTINETTSQLPPDAVVWVDALRAVIARRETDESITTVEVRRAARPEPRYLADIVHEIGNRERVMIVGPEPSHLALEREYVAISHRPDRLVASPVGAGGTVRLLHKLAPTPV